MRNGEAALTVRRTASSISSKADCKPSSVSDAAPSLRPEGFHPRRSPDGGHPSSPSIAEGVMQPTRRLAGPRLPPYLALHRTGFALPPVLPPERCAFTAPFRPYRFTGRGLTPNQVRFSEERRDKRSGGMFLLHFPSARAALPLAGVLAR